MIYSNLTGTKYLQNQGFLLTLFPFPNPAADPRIPRKLQAVQLETGVQAVQLETEVTEAQALRDAPAYEWWI